LTISRFCIPPLAKCSMQPHIGPIIVRGAISSLWSAPRRQNARIHLMMASSMRPAHAVATLVSGNCLFNFGRQLGRFGSSRVLGGLSPSSEWNSRAFLVITRVPSDRSTICPDRSRKIDELGLPGITLWRVGQRCGTRRRFDPSSSPSASLANA
jgi:hypothetical protein